MSAQVYSPPGQVERRSKTFLEWKSIDLNPMNNLLHVRVMLNVIKVFIILFLLV